VDELIVLDIDATVENREPDYEMIKHLAEECRMPLCYGGGVKSAEQVKRIIGLGVEKVAISSAAIEKPELIEAASEYVGSQSVVVVLDVRHRGSGGNYEVFIQNGKGYSMDGVEYSKKAVRNFEARIEEKNKVIEKAGKDLPKDLVIVVEFVKGMTIL
jgi:cyclase